jgi:signal transduction histidine kinase/CheY-like chemotaxis protein
MMDMYTLFPFIGASLAVIAAVYSIIRVAYLAGRKAGLPNSKTAYKHLVHEKEKGSRLNDHVGAQKMEALGTLAGGIAHDFNNILQAIMGFTQIILREKKLDDPDYEKLEAIETSAQRAGELVRRLLIFSRKVESQLKPVDLNHEVVQVSKMLERTIPKMINIKLKLAENLRIINAAPMQLEQVIMNMAINARDAMPSGGELVFETGNATLDENFCKAHLGSTPGEYVFLKVSDTGHGMDRELQERIFEPFFTTKEIGKGTGLGLSMVYGVVKAHKGFIALKSDVNTGTTFEMYFPSTEHFVVTEKPEKAYIPSRGKETILLVDDEQFILQTGKEMMASVGYNVLTAPDAETALELYKKEVGTIDIIVLDIVMPGIGGLKCIDRLIQINPKAKIIVISGYSKEILASSQERNAKAFLPKPFNFKDITQLIRKVLDED